MNVIPDSDPNCVHPRGEVDPYRELVEELRDRVRSLEEANWENRRIIAALTSRILAIEAPQDASKAAEPRSEGLPDRTASIRNALEFRVENADTRAFVSSVSASVGWFVAGAAIGVVGTLLFGS